MIYGEWCFYDDAHKEESKKHLKNNLHQLVDELCENDEFWICAKDLMGNEKTIGWKIEIPHMKGEDK